MLQLGDIHNPTLTPIVGVIAVASLGYMIWHGINVLRSHSGKPSLKLEPIHLIAIGLFIAVGGVGWLLVAGSSRSPTVVSPINGPATKEQPKLSPADVNERIEAIGKAYNIALRARPIADGSSQLLQIQIWPMIKDGKAPEFLNKYADDFKPILDDMQEFAKRYRSWLPDVDRAFLGEPHASYVIGLHRNSLELRQEILNWSDRPYGLDHIERSSVMAEWRRSLESLPMWVSQSQTNLIALRRKYEESQR
jgi:hypothetical protein